jgi:oxygen-independent coproporphyrinogen-3 oxidase
VNKSKKRFLIKGDVNIALMKELIDEFLSPEDYEVDQDLGLSHDVVINEILSSDRDTVKRELYNKLVDLTGRRQEWGALTGVRPVKLAGELIEDIGESKAR